jgi:hypothetical protein
MSTTDTTRDAQVRNREAIMAIVRDYVEGWFDGDAARMDRALHPELVKRSRGLEGDDPDVLETLTKSDMVEATRDGEGVGKDASDRRIEIRIDYLGGGIASVTCLCHCYVDLLELIEMPEGWRIINAVWCLR